MALRFRARRIGDRNLYALDVERLEKVQEEQEKVQEEQAEIAFELKVATHELNNLTNRARRLFRFPFAFLSLQAICLVFALWELSIELAHLYATTVAVRALPAQLGVHARGATLLPASLGPFPAFIPVGLCALLLAIVGGAIVIVDSKPRP